MMKVMFPLIFFFALELTPVVKTYANIQSKYGDNLTNLTPHTLLTESNLKNSIAEKFEQLEKNTDTRKATQPNYWF